MTPATLAPPSANPDRYSAAMRSIHLVRPRVPVDTWTDLDAATYWHKGYQPDDASSVPASMVVGMVSRLFMRRFRNFFPLRRLWEQLGDHLGNYILCARNQSGDTVWNLSHFCAAVHTAYCPKGYDETTDSECNMSDLTIAARGFCNRTTCTHRHSWWRGCMIEHDYQKLQSLNLLRSWGLVNWGGLGMLFPPLRNSLVTPHLSVRKARSHVAKEVVPYYVADKIEFIHRFAPAAMSSANFQHWVRPLVAECVAVCSSQRLRYQAIVALESNSSALMQQWDRAMSDKMWDMQFSETNDMVYDSDQDWGMEYDKLRQLQENPPVGMFPSIS